MGRAGYPGMEEFDKMDDKLAAMRVMQAAQDGDLI